ncbi:MAG: carboxymuconolactone decarboxylase family protein, partial [Candidatus Binatia bacterium]
MRISPIEKPKGLLLRFAHWMSRRRLGKVTTPLKVVFARLASLLPGYFLTTRVLEGGLSLDPN